MPLPAVNVALFDTLYAFLAIGFGFVTMMISGISRISFAISQVVVPASKKIESPGLMYSTHFFAMASLLSLLLVCLVSYAASILPDQFDYHCLSFCCKHLHLPPCFMQFFIIPQLYMPMSIFLASGFSLSSWHFNCCLYF